MESTRVKYGTTERIFSTVSNSSGVPVTGLTDVKLEIYRKSDGKYFDFNDTTFKSSGWTTRQGAMTELDATNSAGVYYYDFNTTGYSTIRVEETYLLTSTSTTGANDPLYGELKVGGFVDEIGLGGGVINGSGRGGGITKKQLEALAEMIWKYKLDDSLTAAEALKKAAEDVSLDLSGLEKKIDAIEKPQPVDLTPVLDRIDSIEIPLPINHSKEIAKIMAEIKSLSASIAPGAKEFSTAINTFTGKMELATEQINSSVDSVEKMKESFEGLEEMVTEFKDSLDEQTDMDRRFSAMGAKMNDEKLEKLQESVTKLASKIVDIKYDILQELNSK